MPPQEYTHGQLYYLQLDSLHFDPEQSQSEINEETILKNLTRLIKEYGFFQPVFFQKTPSGKLQLILGGRRLLAAKKAGWETIPAVYCDKKHCEITLVKNLLLHDLTPLERAEAYQQALAYRISKQQLASIFQSSIANIDDYLSLTKLPDPIKDKCRGSRMYSLEELRDLVHLPEPQLWEAWQQLCDEQDISEADAALRACIQAFNQLTSALDNASTKIPPEKMRTSLAPHVKFLNTRLIQYNIAGNHS